MPLKRLLKRTGIVVAPVLALASDLAEVDAGLTRIADRPALIIWGASDGGFPPTERARFERRFPNHRTVILETAKHYIQEDEPERVAAEIRSFLGTPR